MFKSILITSLRNIFRNKAFSAINFLGLSASMSLGLLVILIIQEQLSFDHFHKDGERIYRVNTMALRTDGGKEPYASSPLPLARVITEDYSFAEQVAQLQNGLETEASFGNVKVPISGLYASNSFLQMFNFPLIKGNASSALQTPYTIVLTEAFAEQLFGKSDPIGQIISLQGRGEFTVTGVLELIPGTTHFDFQALASLVSLTVSQSNNTRTSSLDDWRNYYAGYTYFKLIEGQSTEIVEKALQKISATHYSNLTLEPRDKGYEFYLQPLYDITPGPLLSNQLGRGLPSILIMLLSFLAILILIMACFNYATLSVAKSINRAREIGVRKVVGALRRQVFFQFVMESIVFALLSVLLSYGLLQLLKPALLQLQFMQNFSLRLTENYSLYLYFILFAVIVGAVAGLLPAGYLSRFNPTTVLKGTFESKQQSRLTLRKTLIIAQFMFSTMFVLVILALYSQISYMVEKDYGINDKNTININLQDVEFTTLLSEVSKIPGVISVGGVSHPLGTWADRRNNYRQAVDSEVLDVRDFGVNSRYVENLDVTFLAGKNFDEQLESQQRNHVILNEKALSLFNFADPQAAIGQTIYTDSSSLIITGVVKDFHFRPLTYPIGPMIFRCQPESIQRASIRVAVAQEAKIKQDIEMIWKKLGSAYPLDMMMMEEEIDAAYAQSGFQDLLAIIAYAGSLTIIMACLGMLGMVMYATQTRLKEIGVRKVMGATSWQIVIQLSRVFLVLIGIAIVLGAPAGYFLGGLILQNFAYQISISPLLILAAVVPIILLAALILSTQTIRAASLNPLKFLRHE